MEQENRNKPRCKRCFLRDLEGMEDYLERLRLFRAALPEDLRLPEEAYEGRLHICRECEALQNGTCMECGCYVEMRASVSENRCPVDKW